MLKVFRLLFISVFFILGAAVFAYSAWSYYLAYQSAAWPEALGSVLRDECRSTGNMTSSRHVRYQYTVYGARYESEREYFGLRIASRSCVAPFSEGERIRVYYDPADPSEAVLMPGSWRQPAFGMMVGMAFIVFAGFAFWMSGRRISRSG